MNMNYYQLSVRHETIRCCLLTDKVADCNGIIIRLYVFSFTLHRKKHQETTKGEEKLIVV